MREVVLGVVADDVVRILEVVLLVVSVAGVEEVGSGLVMDDIVRILQLVLLGVAVVVVDEVGLGLVIYDGALILELVLLALWVVGVEDLRIYVDYAGIRGVFLVSGSWQTWEVRKIAKMGRGCVSAASAFFPSAFESRTLQNLKDEKRS